MSLEQFIKHRLPVSREWKQTREIMATHIFGLPPRLLFSRRRPLESTNPYAIEWRLDNFEPITKQPFLTAINGIIEIAQNVHAPVKNISPDVAEFIAENEVKTNDREMTFRDYVFNHLAIQAEADPNAAVVILPKHPNAELIPDYRVEIPDFNDVINERVNIDIRLIHSDHIHYLDEQRIFYYAGEWMHSKRDGKKRFAPYYIELSKDETVLYIPNETEAGLNYKKTLYYVNNLQAPPFAVIGNNLILGMSDDHVVSYRQGTFPGAVAIMNEVIGIKSDSAIVDVRFTYPEKIAQYMQCGAGCVECIDKDNKLFGLNVHYDPSGDCSVCSKCNGAGTIPPDQTPFGTWLMVKDDMFDADSRFVPPVQYITPPLQSAEYLDKKWRETYAEGKRALYIIDQNMTNQSGVSKSYDVREKVTVFTGAVRNLFRVMEKIVNSISGYYLQPENIYFELPLDMNVKTSQDITVELANSNKTSSVYMSQLTKELLLKKFGNTAINRRIIDFLQLTDRFFGMDIDTIVKTKAIYGNSITAADQYIHDKGFDLLLKISRNNENFLTLSDDELKALFDAEIAAIFPVNITGNALI